MERKYKLTLEEMNQIKDWNSKKIVTGDMEEFQKFLLELKRNIVLGGQTFGELDYYSYIDDEEVTIRMARNGFIVAPRPFVSNKPLFSKIINKILMYPYLNDTIDHIEIKDMIIDANSFSLIKHHELKKLHFENCYIKDGSSVNFSSINEISFTYCSIPNLNILSSIAIKKISIDKTRVRSEEKVRIDIIAESLSIVDSIFYTSDLLYKLSLPNLKSLVINKKVFDDSDLILLNKIAPNLKYAKINATITDINTIDYISLLPFYKVDSSYIKSNTLNNILIKDIEAHGNLNFSLKAGKELRGEIIKRLEDAKATIYNVQNFEEGHLLLTYYESKYEELKNECLGNLVEYVKRFEKHFDASKLLVIVSNPNSIDRNIKKYLEYKDKEFDKFIKRQRDENFKSSYILAYENGYRESILSIIDKYYELVEIFHKDLSIWFKNYLPIYRKSILACDISEDVKEELYELSSDAQLTYYKTKYLPAYRDVLLGIMPILKPLFNDYKDIDMVAKAFFKNLSPSFGIKEAGYPFYAQVELEKLDNIISDFKLNKKYNYDLLSILAILKTDSINNYVLRHNDNYNFYKHITLSNDSLHKASSMIYEGKVSCNGLLDAIGYNQVVEKNGIMILDHNENQTSDVKVTFEEHQQNMKNSILNYHLRNAQKKYGLGTMLGGYPHLSSDYFSKYIAVNKAMQENKSIPIKNRFEQLFGDNPDINNADYSIFLDLKFNKGSYVEKTCIYWLKDMFKNGVVLTNDDYKELKRVVIEKHYKLDRDMILYYELIKYICQNYPSFVQRYIEANTELLERKSLPLIWTIDVIGDEEEQKILNDFITSTRIDYESPKKLIKYDPKIYYNNIRRNK